MTCGWAQFDRNRRRKKRLKLRRDNHIRYQPYGRAERRACFMTPDLTYDIAGAKKEGPKETIG